MKIIPLWNYYRNIECQKEQLNNLKISKFKAKYIKSEVYYEMFSIKFKKIFVYYFIFGLDMHYSFYDMWLWYLKTKFLFHCHSKSVLMNCFRRAVWGYSVRVLIFKILSDIYYEHNLKITQWFLKYLAKYF